MFGSLYPKHEGGRPPEFTLGQRREVKTIAKARPGDYDLPFSRAWNLDGLAGFPVARGWAGDISHEGAVHAALQRRASPCSHNRAGQHDRLSRIVDRANVA